MLSLLIYWASLKTGSSVGCSSTQRTSLSGCVTFIDRMTSPSNWTATKNNLVLTSLSLGLLTLIAAVHQIWAATHKLCHCLSVSIFLCDVLFSVRLLNPEVDTPHGVEVSGFAVITSLSPWRRGVAVCSLLRWLQQIQKDSLLGSDG